MEKIIEKIDKYSLGIYIIAGDLLKISFASKDDKERHKFAEASESLQNMSIVLKNIWSELKEMGDKKMTTFNAKSYLKNLSNGTKFRDVVEHLQKELGIEIQIDIEFYEAIKVDGIDKTLCEMDDEYSFKGTLEEYEDDIVDVYGDVINGLNTPYDATIKYHFNEEKTTLEVLIYRNSGIEVDEEDYLENESEYEDWDELLSSFLERK